MRIKWLRIVTALLVLVIVVSGVAFKSGIGTLCSLIIAGIPFTCPLGYLEAALASRNLLPQMWLGVATVLLLVVILGRFFCAWVCPTGLLRQLFGSKPAALPIQGQNNNHSDPAHVGLSSYSGFAVLGGALLSSLLFGFPVFCLICPVGLFFGGILAISRLVLVKQPSLELFILPALLGVELFAVRSWCSAICPLGALLGLLARFNHTMRLHIDREKCLAAQGMPCRACQRACLYGFNISKEKSNPIVNACAKCFECYENCPAKAIRLGLFK